MVLLRLTFDPSLRTLGSNVYPKAGRPRLQRPPAGHAGSADPQDAGRRTAARPGYRAQYPGPVRAGPDRGPWVLVSRPPEAGTPRLRRGEMGRVGEQPEGALLQPDGQGAEQIGRASCREKGGSWAAARR